MYDARLREALPLVRERIEAARRRAGGGAVTLVAVTKGHPLAAVEAALAAGLRECGENRVPELEEKRFALAEGGGPAAVHWHLIGHLQRNKVRRALPLFDLVHSVDTERLAAELSAEAVRGGVEASALLQVNVSGEATKSGFTDDDAFIEAAGRITALPSLRVRGLMTMAPYTDDERVLREVFRRTRELFGRCAREVPRFEATHLSMGMSNDFEIAIEEGSNMVRLGTVLFGERQP